MHTCSCGATFPGTLAGAWEAKLHAERHGHALAGTTEAPVAAPRSLAA